MFNTGCQDRDYRCDDGVTCVFEDEICDGIPQCPSGEDEEMDCTTSAPPSPGKKTINICYVIVINESDTLCGISKSKRSIAIFVHKLGITDTNHTPAHVDALIVLLFWHVY